MHVTIDDVTDCSVRVFHKVIVLLEYIDIFLRYASLTSEDYQPQFIILSVMHDAFRCL